MLFDQMGQILIIKSNFGGFNCRFTAAPFPMIVYGTNAFWDSVHHVMIPAVAITHVATTPKSLHSPS